MYEQFFGFSKRPFPAAPMLEGIIEHSGYVFARETLLRCLQDGTGVALLTASAGLGKSLLCQDLQHRLASDFRVACLCSGQFTSRKSLFQAILFELRAEFQGLSDDEARLGVIEAARGASRDGRGLVVIVDEAHLMPSELLEELRTLSEPCGGYANPMRLLFSAQLVFEERLGERELESLSQRIACHVVLDSLTRDESLQYLHGKLRAAGCDHDVFSGEAEAFIARACDGIPRCLNQLCDHALLSAYTCDERIVSLETARNALGDLRALPLHWNDLGLTETIEQSEADAMEDSWEETINEIAARVMSPQNAVSQPVEVKSREEAVAAEYDPSLVNIVEVGAEQSEPPAALDLFQAIDPWPVAPEVPVAKVPEPVWEEEIASAEPQAAPQEAPAAGVAEFSVDDLYANLDRESESAFGARIPEPPNLMDFLAHFTGQGAIRSEPGGEDIEEVEQRFDEDLPVDEECADAVAMLETIRELQAQLRQVRPLDDDDDIDETFNALPRYDVCEPEEETPEPVAEQPVLEEPLIEEPMEPAVSEGVVEAQAAETTLEARTPTERPACPPPEPAATTRTAEIHEAHDDPAPRFARLFTRLRQQRRAARERLAADRDIL